MIAFIGPDGSGKSSILELVKSRFDYPVFHLKIGKIKQVGSKSSPNTVRQYGLLLSIVKLFYLLIESHFRYLRYSESSRCLIDRHVIEIYVDKFRFGYNGPDFLLDIFIRLVKKPKLCFVILSSPELYVIRKGEITYERGFYLNARYEQLAEICNFNVVYNSGSINDAFDKIEALIENR